MTVADFARRDALVALATSSFAGCSPKPPATQQLPPPTVTVQQPVRKEVQETLEYSGRTEAVETVEIRTRVKGFLAKVAFAEGTEVKKGDLLYEIDPRTFEADVANAQAEVARSEAQVRETTALAENSAKLVKSKAASEEEYIQKAAARDTAIATLAKAKAALDTTKLELSFTKIYAPIDGQIGRTNVTVGNLIGYNEPTLLTNIVSVDPIYVVFDGSENKSLEYDKLIREDGAKRASDRVVPMHVGLAVDKGFPHQGIIDYRDNKFDSSTGTIRIRGVFKNPDRLLSPGLFVRVRIPFGKPKLRTLVPEVAIGTDQRGRYLLTVNAENKVEYKPVQLGNPQDDGTIVILSGIDPKDRVIVNGLQRARPGIVVNPQVAGASPTAPAAK